MEKPIKSISDAKIIAKQEGLQSDFGIFDVNEENVDEIFNKIKEYGKNYEFLIRCTEYALKIRPKQVNSICSLLSKLSTITEYNPCKKFTDEQRIILFNKGLIKDSEPLTKDKIFFEEGSIEKAIAEDDIDKLIEFTRDAGFNPKSKIWINKSQSIYYVIDKIFSEEKYEKKITYMQLMAYYGSIKCFKYALLDNTFDDEDIEMFAIAGGNQKIINLLEQKGVKFDNCFETSIKYHRDDISDWLLNHYKCENIFIGHSVVYFHNPCFIYLLKNYYSNDIVPVTNSIFGAACYGNISLADYLINKCNAMKFSTDASGKNIIHISSLANNVEFCKHFLTEHNFDYDEKSKKAKGKTPFKFACSNGCLGIVKYLAENFRINIEEKSSDTGYTALHEACTRDNVDVVRYLIEKCGAKLNVKSDGRIGYTPLGIAITRRNFNVIKYLVEECHVDISSLFYSNSTANVKEYFEERYSFIEACKKGDLQTVKKLIEEENYYVDQKYDNESALKIASKNNDYELIKYLVVECNAKVNQINISVLHHACEEGNLEMVKFLIEKCKINVNRKNNEGQTAIHIAVIQNQVDIMKYIISQNQAAIEEKDKKGHTVLHLAVYSNNFEVVKFLVEKCGADFKVKDNRRKTPLDCAAEIENVEIVKYFVEKCKMPLPRSCKDNMKFCCNKE